MEIQIAVAKAPKWASRESGDTLEMIERPHGGVSLVLVDGQQSGKGAKAISNLVARKAVSLLAEGVRDGATARAAHDYLYAHHHGKVQATLNIVSIDLLSRTLVLSRNNPNPTYLIQPGGIMAFDSESKPVGLYRHTKPVITELPLAAASVLLVYTDGLPSAGVRKHNCLDVRAEVAALAAGGLATAPSWADQLLAAALARDEQRPADDISILVVAVLPRQTPDDARRLLVRMPLGNQL
jgi:serine phosphatase RsbU (regulator of sigma subunit)